ncbi:MAG: cation transporter, partial [Bacilli bacterium]|nr:cation transporter [Bacilli bacterium]
MRFKNVKLASILCIIGNIFLLIIKGIIGLLTKSQAMIADSINSAVDIFSSLMTFIGNKIASRPRDDCHNLGHGKAEYIFSMLISIVMMITSI